MRNEIMSRGVPKISAVNLAGFEDLLCLDYKIEYSGAAIYYDGEVTKKFARTLGSQILSDLGIDRKRMSLRSIDDYENYIKKYEGYKLARASHQMSGTVYLPSLIVYLRMDGEKINVSAFDNIVGLYGTLATFDIKDWNEFSEFYGDDPNHPCRLGSPVEYLCDFMSPPTDEHPVWQTIHSLESQYRTIEIPTTTESIPCDPLREIRLKTDTIYHFGEIPENAGERAVLKEEWERIFRKFGIIAIYTTPADAWWDDDNRNGQRVMIDLETVERNGYAPLYIKGDVRRFIFKPKEETNLAPMAIPPLLIAEDPSKPPAFEMDLSAFGVGKFNHIFRPQVHAVTSTAGENGEYLITSTEKYPYLDEIHRDDIRAFADVAGRVETEWGFYRGELMNSMYVVACTKWNAHVQATNPTTVIACDSALKRRDEFSYLVPHELAHTLYSSFIRGRYRATLGAYNFLRGSADGREFFRYIAEQNFLPDADGGHPWQNADELFASVLTSLDHPDWIAKVSSSDPKMQRLYLLSLAAAYHDIVSGLGPDWKLVETIGCRMRYMHDMLGLDILKPSLKYTGDFVRIDTRWSLAEVEELMNAIAGQQ